MSVSKSFGAFTAVDDLSFSIRTGELYGLIGPNGAGKTTSVRILCGLTRVTKGKVSVLGCDPRDKRLRPLVGYMPQDTALYQDLTTRENLALFGRLYGLGRQELNARMHELLEFVDLGDRADTIISNLSGGMRHRASLACAMLPKPKLLVLDEPTVGVDPELRANFWLHFADLQKQGTTILITTHYMDEAERCERIGLVNHGTMVAEGSPEEIKRETHARNLEEAFLKLVRRDHGS